MNEPKIKLELYIRSDEEQLDEYDSGSYPKQVNCKQENEAPKTREKVSKSYRLYKKIIRKH